MRAAEKICVYPRPLSAKEAAEWLGISVAKVKRLARDGELPGRKIGRDWRFAQDALAKFAGVTTA